MDEAHIRARINFTQEFAPAGLGWFEANPELQQRSHWTGVNDRSAFDLSSKSRQGSRLVRPTAYERREQDESGSLEAILLCLV